ncbi:MAG TPA: hypothetical protein VN908_01195 [Gemmatimonadales bacterium]|nr:hypothetical protein [Gemmatimonadales bacterium]
MNATRGRRATWIILGLLTATQVGIGAWRAVVLWRGGLAAGVRPLGWSMELGADLLLCGALGVLAWWWLPVRGGGGGSRNVAAWGVRFLLLGWLLVLVHYVWGLATGHLAPLLTWVVLAILGAAGTWSRRLAGPVPDSIPERPVAARPALALAVAFFAAQLPHLVFNYSFTDAKDIWACRAFKLAETGSLQGILECLDPARPPLHAVMLWLGVGDPTFQGRLLPLLMFGAFVLVFYHLLSRVAPRLAPWGVVWLLATDHVLKGQVSTYAGVPVMLAVVVALAVMIDERALAPTRSFAVLIGIVAGAVIALTRRDGLPEFIVAVGVLIAVSRRWRDPLPWAPIAGAAVAYLSWVWRPAALQTVPLFAPKLGAAAGVLFQVAPEPTAVQQLWMLMNGVQGQVFSHYGYGAFVWSWLIVTVWARRQIGAPAAMSPAVLYGIAGFSGWLATVGAYAALTFLGHPHMSSLYVLRTGFGRHLVHFFPLCLLHATAAAQRLVDAERPG